MTFTDLIYDLTFMRDQGVVHGDTPVSLVLDVEYSMPMGGPSHGPLEQVCAHARLSKDGGFVQLLSKDARALEIEEEGLKVKEEFNEEFTAATARGLSDGAIVFDFGSIEPRIREAAAKGESQIWCQANFVTGRTEAVLRELRRRGFHAERVSDHRDGDMYHISW